MPIPIVPDKLFVDVQQLYGGATSVHGSADDTNQRDGLGSASSSSQESAVFEELVNGAAMSTVKGFQLTGAANVASFPSITKLDAGPVRDQLRAMVTAHPDPANLTFNEIESVIHAVESTEGSLSLFVPIHRSTLANWTGVVYYLGSVLPFEGVTHSEQRWVIAQTNGSMQGGYLTQPPLPNPTIDTNRPTYAADPVNIATGALAEDTIDISIPAPGIPLTFARHYESSFAATTLPAERRGDPTLGLGWYGTYSSMLTFSGSTVTWINEKGRQFVFNNPVNNVYTVPNELMGTDFRKDASNNYVFRDKSGIAQKFNSDGYLIQISDLNGNALNIARDAAQNNRVTTVTSTSSSPSTTNATLTFGYNGGKLQTITDGLRTWTYTVTSAGSESLLTEVDSPQDPATSNISILRYAYDQTSAHAQTRVANLLNGKTTVLRTINFFGTFETISSNTTHAYYPNGTVFQTTSPDGGKQTFEYDPFYNSTTFTNERGDRTQYDFDEKGRQIRITNADRSAEKDEWNLLDQRVTHTDDIGVRTAYEYDSTGNLITATEQHSTTSWANSTFTVAWTTLMASDFSSSGTELPASLVTRYGYETRLGAAGLLFSKANDIQYPSGAVSDARHVVNDFDNLTGNLLLAVTTLYNPLTSLSIRRACNSECFIGDWIFIRGHRRGVDVRCLRLTSDCV